MTEPRRVGESLEAVSRRLGVPRASVLRAVFDEWEEAVGPSLAQHTRPASLVDGVLTIDVDEPGWATQVRYLAPELVARFSEVAGKGAVRRVEVRVRPS